MKVKHIAMAVGLFACAASAQAVVVNFNTFTTNSSNATVFSSQGDTFTPNAGSVIGVWLSEPQTITTPNVWNGTPYMLAGYGTGFSITASNGSAFFLQSYDIALGWYQTTSPRPVTVTYDLSNGTATSSTLSLSASAFITPSPQLSVLRVTFSSPTPEGSFNFGYISLDNLNVTAVPEPSVAAMMLAGSLCVVAGVARRRRLGGDVGVQGRRSPMA